MGGGECEQDWLCVQTANHCQNAPGRRSLSWQCDSFKYDGQIWKVLLPGVLANNCRSRGLVLKTLTCAWIILKSQKDWKGNHFLIWFVRRLEDAFLQRTMFYCRLASRSSRANTANLCCRNAQVGVDSLKRRKNEKNIERLTYGPKMRHHRVWVTFQRWRFSITSSAWSEIWSWDILYFGSFSILQRPLIREVPMCQQVLYCNSQQRLDKETPPELI